MNINETLRNKATLPFKHPKEQVIMQRVSFLMVLFPDLMGYVDGGYESNHTPVLLFQSLVCLVSLNYLSLTYLESVFATNELFTYSSFKSKGHFWKHFQT